MKKVVKLPYIKLSPGFICAALLGFAVSGCDQSSESPQDGESFPIFKTTLSLQDSTGQETNVFLNGESITMILTITNISSFQQILGFSNGQIFNIQVFPDGSTVPVWSADKDFGFPDSSVLLHFAPGESKTYKVVWDQTDANDGTGVPVGPGLYTITGFLVAQDTTYSSTVFPVETFEIQS